MDNINSITPKVTVRMLAYKHADYIERALNSVLMQKTNFKYEVVISDDCSNDGTAEILKHYKEMYPNIITYNVNEQNQGVTGNSVVLDSRMHGEYVTSLECDDLCVDEGKRGKHIGKTIYNYVLGFAKEQGCYNVTLNVWSCNETARKFYEKCGLLPQKVGMEKIL